MRNANQGHERPWYPVIPSKAIAPVREPTFSVPLVLGASSIATLLLYFYGVSSMGPAVKTILVPGALALAVVGIWSRQAQRYELLERIISGLWAGGLATLAYDVVRLPISLSGLPVFKAISYFGTIILDQPSPTPASEVVGWAYHLSNGIGFGLMYAAIIVRPRWWTAVIWSLVLEAVMLVTPYAEVFGYKVGSQFLAITISSHVIYGLVLWASLRYWLRGQRFQSEIRNRRSRLGLTTGFAIVPIGIASVAFSFHQQHARQIPPSPPSYIGSHLYITWDVPEPDRIAALWVFKRFVHKEARFHFVPPFSPIRYGQPFDLPEAEIRRQATSSATEVLLAKYGLDSDPRLRSLAAMTHLAEVTPWLLPSDQEASRLVHEIRGVTEKACGSKLTPGCAEVLFSFLDNWYNHTP